MKKLIVSICTVALLAAGTGSFAAGPKRPINKRKGRSHTAEVRKRIGKFHSEKAREVIEKNEAVRQKQYQNSQRFPSHDPVDRSNAVDPLGGGISHSSAARTGKRLAQVPQPRVEEDPRLEGKLIFKVLIDEKDRDDERDVFRVDYAETLEREPVAVEIPQLRFDHFTNPDHFFISAVETADKHFEWFKNTYVSLREHESLLMNERVKNRMNFDRNSAVRNIEINRAYLLFLMDKEELILSQESQILRMLSIFESSQAINLRSDDVSDWVIRARELSAKREALGVKPRMFLRARDAISLAPPIDAELFMDQDKFLADLNIRKDLSNLYDEEHLAAENQKNKLIEEQIELMEKILDRLEE